jgi:hypothetical protein
VLEPQLSVVQTFASSHWASSVQQPLTEECAHLPAAQVSFVHGSWSSQSAATAQQPAGFV